MNKRIGLLVCAAWLVTGSLGIIWADTCPGCFVSEFNTPGDFENWTLHNVQTNSPVVANGYLAATSSTEDPQVCNETVSFSADDVRSLSVRYKGEVSGLAQVFAGTENFPTYISNGNISTLYTTPGSWQLLTFDLANLQHWAGETVCKLRFDPINLPGKDFQIGFIALSDGDFDGDGIFDRDDGGEDPDGDGIVNFRDPDNYNIATLLKSAHPRLMISTNTPSELQALAATGHAIAQREYAALAARAQVLMANAAVTGFPIGPKPLYTSRDVLALVQTLAVQRMVTGDTSYSARIWQEIDSVTGTNFPDWYPKAFLSVAEMTLAVATAYDWLYDDWTPAQRAQMAEAILEKGIKPAFLAYEGDASTANWLNGWLDEENNWAPVCYGGVGCGALAVADVYPEEATRFLSLALDKIRPAMRAFAPDGGGVEGPMYWEYGTLYGSYFLSALDTALGTDFGLSAIDGYEESGFFQHYMSDPAMISYDIEDASRRIMSAPQHFWFSRRYNEPAHSRFRLNGIEKYLNEDADDLVFNHLMPMDLIWFDDSGANASLGNLPLDKHYHRSEIGSSRSAWAYDYALSLFFQGGDNTESHAHHDLGSFILNYGKFRMITDCGVDTYCYSTSQARWSYYRTTAFGHNGLMLRAAGSSGSFDQDWTGTATVADFTVLPGGGLDATLDLSNAHGNRVDAMTRRFELDDARKTLTVTDYVNPRSAMEVYWQVHTEAAVEIAADGQSALLTRANKKMRVTIADAPTGASFMLFAAPATFPPNPGITPNPLQKMNAGISRMAIHFGSLDEAFELRVVFAPEDYDGDGQSDAQELLNGRDSHDASDMAFFFDTDGDDEDWDYSSAVANLAISGGMLGGTTETTSAYVHNYYMNFPADEISTVYVRLKADSGGDVRVGGLHPASASVWTFVTAAYTNAGDWQVMAFDFKSQASWAGMIWRLRVDPLDVANAGFGIDWVLGSGGDRDRDGLPDAYESLADSDGDGLEDFRDPDSDGDGIADGQDLEEPFRVGWGGATGGTHRLLFPGTAGYSYHLERSESLLDPGWISIDMIGPVSSNQSCILNDFTATNSSAFYRVRVGS